MLSRYRDRKLSKTYTFVGADAYVDATARGQIRSAFEAGSAVVSNWDVLESVLDYIFLKLGVDGVEGGVGRSVVMTEPVANLAYSRKSGFLIVRKRVWFLWTAKGYERLNPGCFFISSNDGDLVRMLFGPLGGIWN